VCNLKIDCQSWCLKFWRCLPRRLKRRSPKTGAYRIQQYSNTSGLKTGRTRGTLCCSPSRLWRGKLLASSGGGLRWKLLFEGHHVFWFIPKLKCENSCLWSWCYFKLMKRDGPVPGRKNKFDKVSRSSSKSCVDTSIAWDASEQATPLYPEN